jgi:hypothetical protein
MAIQTLVFNTTTKNVKVYEGEEENSKILYVFSNVPTVRVSEQNYYEVMQSDNTSSEEKRVPVGRFPISITNMLIKK